MYLHVKARFPYPFIYSLNPYPFRKNHFIKLKPKEGTPYRLVPIWSTIGSTHGGGGMERGVRGHFINTDFFT